MPEPNRICRSCGVRKRDLVDVGGSFYCTDCLASRIESAKKIKHRAIPERGDNAGIVNVAFFLLIGLPVGLSFTGFPNFLIGFLVMVHELGHFSVWLLDNFIIPGDLSFLTILAGSGAECLLPLLSFLLLLKNPRLLTVSCVFLALFGTALIDTAGYMGSAVNPYGKAFISGAPMTPDNHDWHIIFATLGLIPYAGEIAVLFYTMGFLAQYTGFYTAITGFFESSSRSSSFLLGIGLSTIHTILIRQYHITIFLLIVGTLLGIYLAAKIRPTAVPKADHSGW